MAFSGFKFGSIVEPLNNRRWSSNEIARLSAKRCALFASHGVTRNDRVLIHYGNSGEFFADLLAVWNLGACAIPLDSGLTDFEIIKVAETAEPKLSVWQEPPSAAIIAGLQEISVATVTTEILSDASDTTASWRMDDPALILFTSGTSGDPKGVVHTHRSLHAQWTSLHQVLGLEPFTNTLCLLPTHFGHGLICNCLFPWLSGQTLHILPRFQADVVSKLGAIIDEHRISFMSSVPSVWRLALKLSAAPKSQTLQQVFVGSAPLSGRLWQDVYDWTGAQSVRNAYGITETASWLAGTPFSNIEPADGLIGVPWGSDIRILKDSSTERSVDDIEPCHVCEQGFVWVRTPSLMQGYYQLEEMDNKVIRQGWFSTGDIGLIDDRNFLFLKGREREEINKGGTKVYPADIDGAVEQYPTVADVCSFGVEDHFYGETIGIAIVLEGGAESEVVALRTWLADRLAEHKLPSKWYLVPQIPRTSRGKINRELVAQTCAKLKPVNMHQASCVTD